MPWVPRCVVRVAPCAPPCAEWPLQRQCHGEMSLHTWFLVPVPREGGAGASCTCANALLQFNCCHTSQHREGFFWNTSFHFQPVRCYPVQIPHVSKGWDESCALAGCEPSVVVQKWLWGILILKCDLPVSRISLYYSAGIIEWKNSTLGQHK